MRLTVIASLALSLIAACLVLSCRNSQGAGTRISQERQFAGKSWNLTLKNVRSSTSTSGVTTQGQLFQTQTIDVDRRMEAVKSEVVAQLSIGSDWRHRDIASPTGDGVSVFNAEKTDVSQSVKRITVWIGPGIYDEGAPESEMQRQYEDTKETSCRVKIHEYLAQ